MKNINAVRDLGFLRYILIFGLGAFGGWIFVIMCFVYALNGMPLALRTLEGILLSSSIAGIAWGVAMAYVLRWWGSTKRTTI